MRYKLNYTVRMLVIGRVCGETPFFFFFFFSTPLQPIMATAISKLDSYKLETKFGDGYVKDNNYEWKAAGRIHEMEAEAVAWPRGIWMRLA